jgi:hypothetical protein
MSVGPAERAPSASRRREFRLSTIPAFCDGVRQDHGADPVRNEVHGPAAPTSSNRQLIGVCQYLRLLRGAVGDELERRGFAVSERCVKLVAVEQLPAAAVRGETAGGHQLPEGARGDARVGDGFFHRHPG